MSEVITVRINFEINTKTAQSDISALVVKLEVLERTLVQGLSLLRRLTGNEDIEKGISMVISMITIINQLRIASALLMATNPWLIGLGLIGLATTAVTAIDVSGSYI